MTKLLEILKEVNPNGDFEHSEDYLEDGLLDSLGVISVLTAFEDLCGIEIDLADVTEEDFLGQDALKAMVGRFGGDVTLL